MNTPWLKTALFTLVLAPTIACFSDNAEFCDEDDQCGESQVCNTGRNTCEAASSLDAGSAPEEECGKSCVQTAPSGWTGPVARAEAAVGEELAACTDAFSEDLGVRNSEIVESGSCSCECGEATGLSCSNGFLREWTSASEGSCELNVCDVIGGDCFDLSQPLFPNTCMEIPSNMKDDPFLRATFGNLRGGDCGGPQVSGELSSAFARQTRLCKAPLESDGCASDEVCAPDAPADFADGLCIIQQGEHECPIGSGYTERTILFAGISDNRSCDPGSCSCSAPTGSCGGKIELYNGGVDADTCDSPLATLQGSTSPFNSGNLCQALPSAASTMSYVVDVDNRSCRKDGDAALTGGAVGTGASTLCCMPTSI